MFKNKFFVFIATLLLLSSCITISPADNEKEQQSMQLTQIAINQQLTQIASGEENQNDSDSVEDLEIYSLGSEHVNEEGGYSFRTISGFTLEEFEGGFIYMAPSDANTEYGPLVSMNTEKLDGSISLYEAFSNVKNNLTGDSDLEAQSETDITVDGWPAISANLTGEIEGREVGGRIVYIHIASTQEFLMAGIAPVDIWHPLSQTFEDVLQSIVFDTSSDSEPLCGNGICGDFEHPGNCPQDCGSPDPEPLCGDGFCGDFENSGNCPQDCGNPEPEPLCGDGFCGDFEHSGNCPQDCGNPQPEPLCGDGFCGDFEHAGNCPQDCK